MYCNSCYSTKAILKAVYRGYFYRGKTHLGYKGSLLFSLLALSGKVWLKLV